MRCSPRASTRRSRCLPDYPTAEVADVAGSARRRCGLTGQNSGTRGPDLSLRRDRLAERDVVAVRVLDAKLTEAVRRVIDRVVDLGPPLPQFVVQPVDISHAYVD